MRCCKFRKTIAIESIIMVYCNYYIDLVGVQCCFKKFNLIALLKSAVQASKTAWWCKLIICMKCIISEFALDLAVRASNVLQGNQPVVMCSAGHFIAVGL